MEPQRWAVIQCLYFAARDKTPDQRAAYLAGACKDDTALRSEIESLLGYSDSQSSGDVHHRLDLHNFWEQIAALHDEVAGTESKVLPAVIGRYRIRRFLGQGGMGTVYAAEQEQPRRTVALKVIKSGLTSPSMLRRFEQEFQALGRLRHPGIAHIYEASSNGNT